MLDGIDAAVAAGLGPVKVNAVVKRGVNDHGIEALAERFRGTGVILRFIEFMDVGSTNGWRLDDVVPAQEIVDRDRRHAGRSSPSTARTPGDVATRWRYRDGAGEIGVIASVTQPFCGACTRARISAEGRLYTCLFAAAGHDLRELLRSGVDDATLDERIRAIWSRRTDRYSDLRTAETTGAPEGRDVAHRRLARAS